MFNIYLLIDFFIYLIFYLISSFCRVQNVVCFLLGDSPASDARESPKRKQTIIFYYLFIFLFIYVLVSFRIYLLIGIKCKKWETILCITATVCI